METRFYVTDNTTGVLDNEVSFATETEATAFIEQLEDKDKKLGRYTEGFYAIVEADPEEVE